MTFQQPSPRTPPSTTFALPLFLLLLVAPAHNLVASSSPSSIYTSAPGYNDCATCGGGKLGHRTLLSSPSAPTTPSEDHTPEGQSGTPLPYAVDHRRILNKNDDLILPLRNRLEIADAGETSFPIYVPDDFVVQDVKFTMRGFFHEHAGDVAIKLKHNVDRVGMPSLVHNATASTTETASLENMEANEVIVVDQRLGAMTFGKPRDHPFPNTAGNGYPTPNRVRGDGFDYIVHDLNSPNIALHKPTNQSSTAYGGHSSKAVDGVTNGHYGEGSVTHTAGHGATVDPQAWWQVDLEAVTTIGTIGVWNRIQEDNVDEIQTITADAAETMQGTFTLSFNFSGTVATTKPILHNAPASIADEDANTIGESMQAKLQGLSNVGTVLVQRQVFDAAYGGHTWVVTFLSEPGNLNSLVVADVTGLTAQGSSVDVATVRDGNSNVWYNYKYGLSSIRGRLYPAWLMVLPEDPSGNKWANLTCQEVDLDNQRGSQCPLPGIETLNMAKEKSVWKMKITENAREAIFRLPSNIKGKYVRIQLESSTDYLSLAEVSVKSSRSHTFRDYTGGSPVSNADVYQPEETLNGNFGGMQARGTWLLSFSDTVARTTVKSTQGNDRHDSHGRGAIDDWVLVLTDNQGIARTYHMDISAVVKTLPIYGKLYIYDTKYEARGRPIEFVKGTDQNNEISGSIASWNIVVKNRQVVYSPRRDYLGEDVFSYTTFFGVTESTNTGVVTLETRECRQADCLNDVSSSATANLHELWYRDEGEPLNAYIPRTEDLLDLTNQINDPWLTQPSAGIQGGSCGDAGVVCPGDVSTATFAVPQNQV